MSITIRIPTTLRNLTEGSAEVSAEGSTVAEALNDLESKHPGFKERILEESGEVRRFVNVFVDDEDTRYLEGIQTPVSEGQTLSLVPAVAGGSNQQL